jgi:hypothetical protein
MFTINCAAMQKTATQPTITLTQYAQNKPKKVMFDLSKNVTYKIPARIHHPDNVKVEGLRFRRYHCDYLPSVFQS